MTLSVVIPARNAGPFLGRQLDALTRQAPAADAADAVDAADAADAVAGVEILVVDDGSTDDTAEVVRSFAARSPAVRLMVAAGLPGAAHARNAGVRAARHDRIAFCDADDVVAPGWVAAMEAALAAHEFVSGPVELDRLNPPALAESRGRSDSGPRPTFHGIFPRALGSNWGVRRPVFDRLGGLDQRYSGAEDIEFSMRAWRAGVELAWVPDACVHYRYRAAAGDLWRQGIGYGRARVAVCQRLAAGGGPVPARLAGWRSWAWLAVHLHRLVSARGRATWIWVAGNRAGQLSGSIRYRTLFL